MIKELSQQFPVAVMCRLLGALAKNHVFEYIEIYYNRKRLHSTIGYKTPELFEIKIVA